MKTLAQTTFFFIIMISIQSIGAVGVFDILDETIYTGDWNETENSYSLPPDDGTWKSGNIYVITGVGKNKRDRGRYLYRIYARDYHGGIFDESGKFGTMKCRGDGCWVEGITGSRFFVTESVYNSQSNHTKQLIDASCGGVVPNGWKPFFGDPKNPYDVTVQNEEVVWGYVGIHFDNISKLNGEYCIPSEDAISIVGGSWDSVHSKKYDRGKKRWQHLWGVTDETSYSVHNKTIAATINITVEWAHVRRDGEGVFQYSNHTSRATFTDTAVMPNVLDSTHATATIVCHNNSVTPYSLIDVHHSENVTSTEIQYQDSSSTYHNKIGIMTSSDDLEYFSFIDEAVWLPDTSNIVTRRGGYYVINEAPLNMSELVITVSTPYTSFEIVDYNATVVHSKPSDYIHWKVMFAFLAVLGLFLVVPCMLLRRLR